MKSFKEHLEEANKEYPDVIWIKDKVIMGHPEEFYESIFFHQGRGIYKERFTKEEDDYGEMSWDSITWNVRPSSYNGLASDKLIDYKEMTKEEFEKEFMDDITLDAI